MILLAIQNGIKEDNYIVIDCRESKLEWIKENILNSELSIIFDLSIIDWNKCEDFALSNLCKSICEFKKYNLEMSANKICKIFKLDVCTITKYLKQGNLLGWCEYDPKEEMRKSIEKLSKQVEIFKDNISLGVFKSSSELSRLSEELFGVKLSNSKISEVALGRRLHHKRFTFQYV